MHKIFYFLLFVCLSYKSQAQNTEGQIKSMPISAEGILSIEDKGDYKIFEIVNYAQVDKMHDATLRDRITSLAGIKSFGITWAEMRMTIAIENKYIVKYLTEEFAVPSNLLKEFEVKK